MPRLCAILWNQFLSNKPAYDLFVHKGDKNTLKAAFNKEDLPEKMVTLPFWIPFDLKTSIDKYIYTKLRGMK